MTPMILFDVEGYEHFLLVNHDEGYRIWLQETSVLKSSITIHGQHTPYTFAALLADWQPNPLGTTQ